MNTPSYFNHSATSWDTDPNRIELAKAVGEAMLREAPLTKEMDLGFDRAELKAQIIQTGFKNVKDMTVHAIRKPVQGGGERDFPVFLMTAMS